MLCGISHHCAAQYFLAIIYTYLMKWELLLSQKSRFREKHRSPPPTNDFPADSGVQIKRQKTGREREKKKNEGSW